MKKKWSGGVITPEILNDCHKDPEFQSKVIGELKRMLEKVKKEKKEKR
jgi:hypothetical protein